MHHHHGHSCHHADPVQISYERRRRMQFVLLLNLAFVVIEVVGGLLTGSSAILADAVHDLGDVLGLGVALYAERKASAAADAAYTMGYRRWSTFGSVIVGVVLLWGCGFTLLEAIPDLFVDHQPHSVGMMILAGFGIAVNLAGAWVLSRGNHTTEALLSWHLFEDVLGWAVVLLGGLLINQTGWGFIDPAFAVLISIFIARGAIRHLREPLGVLLQKSPEGFNLAQFEHDCLQIPGVQSVHHVFHWSLTQDQQILSVHVVTAAELSARESVLLKSRVRGLLAPGAAIHSTIELEFPSEVCTQSL